MYSVSLFTNYAIGPVSFSVIFYVGISYVFFNRKKTLFSPKTNLKKTLAPEVTQQLLQLEKLMKQDKVFKDSSIKLGSISSELGITSNRLSQLLNDNLEKSFSQYINEYRVEEAKQLLIYENKYTIEGIGFEAGFSSKSSFFSIFKKHTNLTPSAFKKSFFTPKV